MSTNPTPSMDARFACLVTGERSSDYKQHEYFSVYLWHNDGRAACFGESRWAA